MRRVSGDQPAAKRRVERGGADLELAGQAVSHRAGGAGDRLEVAGKKKPAYAVPRRRALVGQYAVQSQVADVVEGLAPGGQRLERLFDVRRALELGHGKSQC